VKAPGIENELNRTKGSLINRAIRTFAGMTRKEGVRGKKQYDEIRARAITERTRGLLVIGD